MGAVGSGEGAGEGTGAWVGGVGGGEGGGGGGGAGGERGGADWVGGGGGPGGPGATWSARSLSLSERSRLQSNRIYKPFVGLGSDMVRSPGPVQTREALHWTRHSASSGAIALGPASHLESQLHIMM